jgi:threonine/homoserine/homoserine lactone efflux protein
MGAATADALYGFVAAFGLTIISDFLSGQQFWLRLGGGVVLCFLGTKTLIEEPRECREVPKTLRRYAGMYTSTFLLTITNPMTIFSFAAVFAGFGLAGAKGSLASAGTLVLGVFLGSALWWLLLVGIFSIYRRRHQGRELRWVNRIAGGVITLSGLAAFLSLIP